MLGADPAHAGRDWRNPGSTGITAIDLAVITAWGTAGIAAALADFRWQPHDSW